MLGEVGKDKLIVSSGAQAGDEKFSPTFLNRAKGYLTSPGISVLEEALIAVETGGVHAMHDPTEGGVATAIHELAHAANLGVVVWQDALLISDETAQFCRELDLNPLGVISSGALLIAADPTKSNEIASAITERNIPCQIIGQLLPPESGCWLEVDSERCPLPIFETDEITKVFRE
jgi:hydrogenase maturation factor